MLRLFPPLFRTLTLAGASRFRAVTLTFKKHHLKIPNVCNFYMFCSVPSPPLEKEHLFHENTAVLSYKNGRGETQDYSLFFRLFLPIAQQLQRTATSATSTQPPIMHKIVLAIVNPFHLPHRFQVINSVLRHIWHSCLWLCDTSNRICHGAAIRELSFCRRTASVKKTSRHILRSEHISVSVRVCNRYKPLYLHNPPDSK